MSAGGPQRWALRTHLQLNQDDTNLPAKPGGWRPQELPGQFGSSRHGARRGRTPLSSV